MTPTDPRAVLDHFTDQIRVAAITADDGLNDEMADRQTLLEDLLSALDTAFRDLPQEYRCPPVSGPVPDHLDWCTANEDTYQENEDPFEIAWQNALVDEAARCNWS